MELREIKGKEKVTSYEMRKHIRLMKCGDITGIDPQAISLRQTQKALTSVRDEPRYKKRKYRLLILAIGKHLIVRVV